MKVPISIQAAVILNATISILRQIDVLVLETLDPKLNQYTLITIANQVQTVDLSVKKRIPIR